MGENLRGRVADRAAASGAPPGGEVAQRPAAPVTLVDKIRAMEDQFQLAAPRGHEATQLIRDALTALRTTRNLDQCESTSVLGGLMTCAQLGLRPGVLGHAWLVPFWNSKLEIAGEDGRPRRGGHQAQLVIGYQGLVDLAYRSGLVEMIAARTAFTNDEFRLEYGVEDVFRHVPTLDGLRGDPRLFYAVARIKGGGFAMTDPMTVAEMEAYRNEHATAKKDGRVVGPWVDNFEGMAHKTMIRRLAKLLPKSTELARALEADERVHVNLEPTVVAPGEFVRDGVIEGEVGDDASSAAAGGDAA